MIDAKIKYEELLRKLVLLPNESEEADKIRDESDSYWLQMTDLEKAEIRVIAEELYKDNI